MLRSHSSRATSSSSYLAVFKMRVRPHHRQFRLLTRRKAVDNPAIRAISLCIALLLLVVLPSSPHSSLLVVSAFSITPSTSSSSLSSSNRHLLLPLHQQQQQQLLQPFAASSHPFRSSRASSSTTPRISLFSTSSSSSSEEDAGADNSNNKENYDNEAEWKAVVSAFKMYKAAYGDLKIPQKFVVPTLAPWPNASQGLRLGKIVQEMRATGGKYLASVPPSSPKVAARRQVLEDLGFVWRMRQQKEDDQEEDSVVSDAVPLEQLYRALQAYKRIEVDTYRAIMGSRKRELLEKLGRTAKEEPWEVLSNYIIPNSPPWPEDVRGLPLAQQVQSLKRRLSSSSAPNSGNNDRNDPAAWREKFELLGLASLAAATSTTTSAVATSTTLAATTTPELAEPVGGTAVAPARSVFNNAKETASTRSSTNESDKKNDGPTAADNSKAATMNIRFNNVYEALKTYKSIYGDLLVPQPFAVPRNSKEWPEETWGLRLGARVNAIRSQGTFVNNNPERRTMLDDLGFVWSTPKDYRTRRRGQKAIRDSEREGSEDDDDDEDQVHVDDVDDVDTTAPKEELDAEWRQKSSPSSSSALVDALFDESFDFGQDFGFLDDGGKQQPTWGLVEGGGSSNKDAYSSSFEDAESSADDEYAQPMSLAVSLKEATERAIKVGVIEGLTPNNRVIKGKQQKDIPWFNDDFGDDFVFEDVVEALKIYKSIYGDFSNLTEEFVVPSPKEVTGFLDDDDDDDAFDSFSRFDVDASARAAAAIASYEEQGDLSSSEDLIAAEIRRLQGKVGQQATTSMASTKTSVVIESAVAMWPEALSGMQLGSIVSRIRDGSLEVKHLPERKQQVDALVFDWGNPDHFIDVPFEKAMCAMYAYYLIRGDLFVYEDFVMPDEDPWPQALAGYEIGKAVNRLRELQNFLEAYHPEKVSLLRMIDFVWFPTMALPLDPKETEMNTELLLLSAMGHPDYAKMIDIPMGLPDKIIADGPFLETDDPKLWWRKWHNWDYVKDYWYQQGRRDNAFVLRRMGYPMMADEHEAKYGPGLFAQINETLEAIEDGIEGRTLDEKRELLETLNFYGQEMLGCTDIRPEERNKIIAKLDSHMIALMKDPKLRILPDVVQQVGDWGSSENEDDIVNGSGAQLSEDDYVDEEVEVEVEEEDDQDIEVNLEDFEIDVEDELGLDLQ